ncbi:MAG: hypothetical protein ACI80K_000115 [Paracoccaceae bacterium]|jgi:hypothetical protein
MNQWLQNPSARRATSRRRIASLPSALRGQRVVPLPLAMAAVAIPFLTVWASAGEPRSAGQALGRNQAIQGSRAEARPLDEPFVFLGRDVRLPATEGGYVDIWAVPVGWEADLLQRRGH